MMKTVRLFIRVVDKVSEWIGLAVSVLMPAMVVVLTYEVVARYVFERPTIWVYNTAIFMFGYCGLLGGAYVLKYGEHINVDVLHGRLSPRGKAIMDTSTGLLFFFIIVLLIIYSWKEVVISAGLNEHSPTEWGPPMTHFKLMITVGAFLLLMQGIANWIRSLNRAIKNRDLEK